MARTHRPRDMAERPIRKRALLVGINRYPSPFNRLKGCVNDALMMAQMLMDSFGFQAGDDMRMLTDDRATKQAILDRLDWLVADARPGDVLVFHYSGHGAQVPDRTNGNVNGVDECICPVDFSWDDPLTDAILQDHIGKVSDGVNLTVILDCCHAAREARDLIGPFPCTPKRILPPPDIRFRAVADIVVDSGKINRSVTMSSYRDLPLQRFGDSIAEGGIVVAGCKADQLSNDAWIDNDYHGALTYSLYQAMKQNGATESYADWVATATRLLKSQYHIQDQDPQLEASSNRDRWSLFSVSAAPRAEPARVRAARDRHIVYVHGIGQHSEGYSDGWWDAMKDYVPSIPNGQLAPAGNRWEVLWSKVVRPTGRSAMVPRAGQDGLAQAIQDVLLDRAVRQFIPERLATVDGSRSAETINPRSLLQDIPGIDLIGDFTQYLLDSSIRNQVLDCFFQVVRPLLDKGSEIEIISHSWGTVVAYEALRRLEDDGRVPEGIIPNWFTVGSALSIAPVRPFLERRDLRKPSSVRTWSNLDARGDVVGGPLQGYFGDLEDYLHLEPVSCNRFLPSPVCAHSSYFQAGNLPVNQNIFGANIEP
jgi:metacaspase-1